LEDAVTLILQAIGLVQHRSANVVTDIVELLGLLKVLHTNFRELIPARRRIVYEKRNRHAGQITKSARLPAGREEPSNDRLESQTRELLAGNPHPGAICRVPGKRH